MLTAQVESSRRELELRGVRIQELEESTARMRRELAANEELIAKLRLDTQEASSRLSIVQVRRHLTQIK